MNGTNNGRRLTVIAGDFRVEHAGVVEFEGNLEIAFPGKARDWKDVREVTIDGARYTVLRAGQSEFVSGMVRLTVTAVT